MGLGSLFPEEGPGGITAEQGGESVLDLVLPPGGGRRESGNRPRRGTLGPESTGEQ
jgi:hypothetical protein